MKSRPAIPSILISAIAAIKQWQAFRHLQDSLQNPEKRQWRVLKKIIRQNRSTEFGRQYGFNNIHAYEDFCAAIPVHNARSYAGYLDRCLDGNYKAICHEKPLFFAMTAGSTGNYKYIPVTKTYIHDVRQSILAFYQFLAESCPETRHTPIQFLAGSAEGGFAPDGTPMGFMSGFNYKNLPAAISRKFVIPYWVFTLSSAADRYYAMARFLVEEPELSAIGAFSPVNISNIAKYAILRLPALIADLDNGSMTLELAQPPANVSFTPNSVLARKLAGIAGHAGNVDSANYQAVTRLLFPGFKYAVCWQGGNMAYATRELQHYFGDKALFEMPFSASEGIFAIPHKLHETGGIAAITSHFLEFIPEEEIYSEKPAILPVWKIEQGKYYYLVITTSGGLYRYNMEDLVYVKGLVANTPEIEFIAKLQRQVSIANERITENDVVNAVTNTLSSGEPVNFVLMPTNEKRYILLIDSALDNIQDFANELEKQLCHASKGYAFEREDCLLEPVLVAQVGNDELRRYIETIQFKSDLPTAQFKPVHICNDFNKYREFSLVRQVAAITGQGLEQTGTRHVKSIHS